MFNELLNKDHVLHAATELDRRSRGTDTRQDRIDACMKEFDGLFCSSEAFANNLTMSMLFWNMRHDYPELDVRYVGELYERLLPHYENLKKAASGKKADFRAAVNFLCRLHTDLLIKHGSHSGPRYLAA